MRRRFEAADDLLEQLPQPAVRVLLEVFAADPEGRWLVMKHLPSGSALVLRQHEAITDSGLTELGLDAARLAAVSDGLLPSREGLMQTAIAIEGAKRLMGA